MLKKFKKKYERTLTERDTFASKFVRKEGTERLADLEVEEERRVCFIVIVACLETTYLQMVKCLIVDVGNRKNINMHGGG